ncbi:MAG: hypothetical protein Q7K35_02730 [bacterium]|nr:hypothetical protein [bacterium]
MIKNKFTLIFWICFYFAVFSILINNSFNYLDNDFGWHLKVGEQIVKERAVPSFDYYDYTLAGRTWVDHEWLANAAVYLIYQKAGYIAVNILFALVVTGVLIILNYYISRYFTKKGAFFIAAFGFLGLVASLPHFGVRVQELSVINLLLLFLIMEHYTKSKSLRTLFFIPPLFYFWSTIHGGFLIGIFVMFFWLLVKAVEIFLNRFSFFSFLDYEKKMSFKNLFNFLIFSFAGVGATLLTPYGLKLYSFLIDYRSAFYLTRINEWVPFYYLPLNYWQIFFEAFLVSAVILAFYLSLKKKNYKISIWEMAVSLFFLALAFKSRRHFPLLFIAAFPFLIKFFTAYIDFSFEDYGKKWIRPFFIIKFFLISGILCSIVFVLLGVKFTNDPLAFFKKSFPYAAANFLKEHPEYNDFKIFNNYGWGGYLIWILPERKLFIDGRLPQLPFAGHTFLEEYYEFWQAGKAEEKLNQYEIRLVFINNKERYLKINWFEKYFLGYNEEKLNNIKNNLKNYLNGSERWQTAYQDDLSTIYVKNDENKFFKK